MPLETATYVASLVATNPPGTDGLNQADDHLRLIKAVLLATFPNLTGAVTATQAQLNELASGTIGFADGTSGAPSIGFTSEATLGVYRASAGHLKITGGVLQGNGAVPVGTLHAFPKDPGSTVVARGGTATGTEQYIELDGSTYNIATFPDLAAFLGTTFGGNGTTTFAVPNTVDTGRYLRSRSSAQSIAIGTYQANVFKTHTHTTDSQGAHQHGVFLRDAGHTHNYSDSGVTSGTSLTQTSNTAGAADTTRTTNVATTGITIGSVNGVANDNLTASSGGHTHTALATGDTASQTGVGETRPESFVVMTVLKT